MNTTTTIDDDLDLSFSGKKYPCPLEKNANTISGRRNGMSENYTVSHQLYAPTNEMKIRGLSAHRSC